MKFFKNALDNPKKTYRLVLPTLFLLNFITYIKALKVPLVSDDFVCVIDLSNWGFFGITFFRPIVKLYFDIFRPFLGMNPVGYHIFNICLHTINAYLLFLLFRLVLSVNTKESEETFRKALLAFGFAIAFALTNTYSEAVYWIAGVTSLWESFFVLIIVYNYSLFIFRDENKYMVISLVLFLIGLGAKEGVFMLIAILPMLTLAYRLEFPKKKIIISWAGIWALGLIYFLVANRVFSLAKNYGGLAYKVGFSLFRNIQQFVYSLVTWRPYNDVPLINTQAKILGIKETPLQWINPWTWVGLGCFIFLLFILIRGKNQSRISFMVLIFSLLPVSLPPMALSGWFAYPYPIRNYYNPTIFYAIMIALFIAALGWFKSKKIVTIIFCGLVGIGLINSVSTFKRGDDWILVGQHYNYVINRIQNTIQEASTPKVLVKIIDGLDSHSLSRLDRLGINVDYNAALSRIYHKQRKSTFKIHAQRYKTRRKALLSLKPKLKRALLNKKTTLYLYHLGGIRRVTAEDFEKYNRSTQ